MSFKKKVIKSCISGLKDEDNYLVIYRGFKANKQGILFDSSYIDCTISGTVGPHMVCTFLDTVSELEEHSFNNVVEFAVINFSSGGGYLFECLNIIDIVESYNINGINLTKICMFGSGFIASAGLLIFLTGYKRNCSATAKFMYHQLSAGCFLSKLKDMDNYVEFLKKIEEDMDSYIMSKTKMKKRDLLKFKADDVYFGAEEALKYGIVENII